jgi:tetratricopeptide (TPR) repeat protein
MALADLARIQKDYPRALELFEKARNEYVTSVERQAYAETRRGEVFEEQGDKKKALDTYKEASGIDPTFAPPYFLIGRLFANDKTKREAAGKLFEKYLELAPRGEYADQAKKFMEKAK